jgi:hypothetical protein
MEEIPKEEEEEEEGGVGLVLPDQLQNPWAVDSIMVFNYYLCPECDFQAKTSGSFETHALENHPLVSTFCLRHAVYGTYTPFYSFNRDKPRNWPF